MKVSLYDLTDAYLITEKLIEEHTEAEFIEAMKNIDEAFEEKAVNIAKMIRNYEYAAQALKQEEGKLKEKRQTAENAVKRLKNYLENSMIITDKRKFKKDIFSFWIQKNPTFLKIQDEKEIPEEYYRTEKILMKDVLKKDILENGVMVDGVTLEQTESIRIR